MAQSAPPGVKGESPLRNRAHSILGLVSALVLLGGSAHADFIELIQVGTWTENPGNFQPSSGSELQLGGKFVIKTGYNRSDYWNGHDCNSGVIGLRYRNSSGRCCLTGNNYVTGLCCDSG